MQQPHIVIVGAGFAGLGMRQGRCGDAPGARHASIDRDNYHLFVPLLYQVATAALSPADIARPIRRILGRYEQHRCACSPTSTGIDTAGAHG